MYYGSLTDPLYCGFRTGRNRTGVLFFGGDYSRTERLEYEDDEYYYYVKAVPKAMVATSERSIKKINAEHRQEKRKSAEQCGDLSSDDVFQGEERKADSKDAGNGSRIYSK